MAAYLPRKTKCSACLFAGKGLLILGFLVLVCGILLSVATRVLWPSLAKTIGTNDIQRSGAKEIPPKFQLDGKTKFVTLTGPYQQSPNSTTAEDNLWVYYWDPAKWEEGAELRGTHYNLILDSIDGTHHLLMENLTFYMRYNFMPVIGSSQNDAHITLHSWPSSNLVVYGCGSYVTFFAIHVDTDYPVPDTFNFTVKFLVEVDGLDEEGNDLNCREGAHLGRTERLIRALSPIVATTFGLIGGLMMMFWVYQKITSPETVLYEIVGEKPVELKDF